MHSPLSFLYYQYITQKNAVLCLYPVKLFQNFCHSAAPNPYNYVAALVLYYGTQGSIRDLNRWEYTWLLLPPTFNAKQHRWRENSCDVRFFKLTNNRWRDIFNVLFRGVFRVKECIELIWHLYKYDWGECKL